MGVVSATRNDGVNFKLLETGSAVIPKGVTHLDLVVLDLRLSFNFAEESGGQARVDSSLPDAKSLALTFVNFSSSLPITLETDIGNVSGKTLVLVTSILMTGDLPLAHRTIIYSFYQKE